MSSDVLAGLLFAAGTVLLGAAVCIWEQKGIEKALDKITSRYEYRTVRGIITRTWRGGK